jgi:IclR family pca regulon transcriptional regulator
VLDGAEFVYVDRAQGFRRKHMVDPSVRVGSRLPAYCTSMGKVLLANLPVAVQLELVGNMTLTRRGPNSIVSKKALRAELEDVFDEGMAVSDEELRAGLVSIAAPIRDERREVIAAVNIEAYMSMISLGQMVYRLSPHLLATADNISARLGYRRDDEAAR